MGDPNLTLKFFFIKHQILKLYIRKMGGFLEEKKLFFFKVKSRIEIYYQVIYTWTSEDLISSL